MSRGILFALIGAALIGACAHVPAQHPAYVKGKQLVEEGRWEEGLAQLEVAAREAPRDYTYRAAAIDARARAVNTLLRQGLQEREAERHSQAEALYRRVLRLQPDEPRAIAGLQQTGAQRRRNARLQEAEQALAKGEVVRAEEIVRLVRLEEPRLARATALQRRIEERKPRLGMMPPSLSAAMRKPISLDFRDGNLKMILDVVSRASGVNFILDKDIRPDAKASIFVKGVPIDQAVDSLLATNQLAKKVVNDTTLLVYPNTPQKNKEYQDLVIRNFYLASIEAKQMQTLLRTILKAGETFIDERRNLLVMRDTPESIELAERLIAAHDQSEPEVMLEVEILEVGRTKASELGVELPERLTLGAADPITLRALRELDSGGLNVGGLSTIVGVNLRRVFSDVNLLANPRIRVRNREKAKVHVGDRVPVISSAVSTTTAITSQTVSYLDVGLKLEVEPYVLDDEVVMKVSLEVSSISREVIVQGSIAYQVGTRNASTTLTLKDGETQVLAGLITDNERESTRKFPGLSDLPVLGRLFSSKRADAEKTEVVLSITPRIVKRLERPEALLTEYWSGPDAGLRSAAPAAGPAGAPAALPGAVPAQPGASGRPFGRALPVPVPAPAAPAAPGAPSSQPAPPASGAPSAPGAAQPFIFQPPPGVGSQ